MCAGSLVLIDVRSFLGLGSKPNFFYFRFGHLTSILNASDVSVL